MQNKESKHLSFVVTAKYYCLLLITCKTMFLTKSWCTKSSLLSPTDNTGEVEVVVGLTGLRARRLRHGSCFGRGPRTWTGHPRFVLCCRGSSRLPVVGLRLRRGRSSLCAKRRARRTCRKHHFFWMKVTWGMYFLKLYFLLRMLLQAKWPCVLLGKLDPRFPRSAKGSKVWDLAFDMDGTPEAADKPIRSLLRISNHLEH